MNLLTLTTLSATIIILSMMLLWLLSLGLKNASIVDTFWGIGFIIVTWAVFYFSPGQLPRKQLITTLVTLWGLRLALHISIRNWGKGEDFRYAKWRTENGSRWWWYSFMQVFLLQGCLMWIISLPLIAAQTSGLPAKLTPLDFIGASLSTFGLIFESVADAQLTYFKTNPGNKGKLLTTGLWKYSRHPNYFGEAVVWWGFYLIALATGYWWTLFSPIIMTFLLVNVSGISMLEQTMKLKPGYEEYMQKTNAFIPWLPRR